MQRTVRSARLRPAARTIRRRAERGDCMTVTAAKGFRAAGVAAGLKSGGAPDVALVVNDGPDATAAGLFTANRVKAAPVLWSQQVLRAGIVRAVVLNSGGANACTGAEGFQDAHATAEHAATRLSAGATRFPVGAGDVALCSTGLIGERLALPKLLSGVDAAIRGLARDGGAAAAEAIMTTDTRPKTAVVHGAGFTVGGMAKGAGMLAPALATMLCVLTTDGVADASTLDGVLRQACRVSFERLDSDGCLSTNDTVLLLASGASGIAPSPSELADAVTTACLDLARQLLADAEGSTKDITIDVTGAADEADAVEVGRAVAGRGGHHGGHLRPGRRRRGAQRHLGLPGRGGGRGPVQSGPVRPRGACGGRPARRIGSGDRMDQRPVAGVRPRELGVLDMSERSEAAT